MCGRYFLQLDGKNPEMAELTKKIKKFRVSDFTQGEVFPTQKALVLVAGKEDYEPCVKPWGIHGFQDRLLINARMEGIENKPTFAPYLKNKCVIPCNGFYEWISKGKKKDKILIEKKARFFVYLAGFFNQKDEFVIVTGESTLEMKKIHERTPLILTSEQVNDYLKNKLPFLVDNKDLRFEKQ